MKENKNIKSLMTPFSKQLFNLNNKNILITGGTGSFGNKFVELTLKYQNPIPAPISKGDKIGVLEVKIPHQKTLKMEVFAGRGVKQLGFLGRLVALFTSVIWGVSG
mgnify:CR=1 FL=1